MKSTTVRGAVMSCVVFVLTVGVACAADPIPGIGPAGEVRQLHTDLQFTEGPAGDGKGNVYFSDIPANRIYKIDGRQA